MKKCKATTKSSATTPGIRRLWRLLRRGKKDLAAIWMAGEWLDKHFNREHASPDGVSRISAELKKTGNNAPISVNHLHKCRQFRNVIRKPELNLMVKRGMSWRRVIGLIGIKTLIEGLPAARRPKAILEFKTLIRGFPGSKAEGLPAWVKSVEDSRKSRRRRNQIVQKIKLLKECTGAAAFRLKQTTAQFKKMREFVPKTLLGDCRNLLAKVDSLIKAVEKLYANARESRDRKLTKKRSRNGLLPWEEDIRA